MSPVGGTATRPSTTATVAVRQPARAPRAPVELQRRRADDDRRVGVVGLERGERLDGLAQALLVGEERAPRVEHVADAGPLERLQLAAEARGDLGDRLALGRARAADGAGASSCSARSALEHRRGARASTSTPCSARKRVERARRARGRAAACGRVVGARAARSNASPIVGSHSTSSRSASPSTPRREVEPRGRRPRRRARATARSASAAASSRADALLAQRRGAVGGQRREQPRPSRSTDALAAAPRAASPARVSQHQPAAPVVARGAHAPDPALRRRRAARRRPRRWRVSSGKRASTSATCTPTQSSTGAHHSRAVPVEAPVRDRPHGGDDVRVVGEAEHDDRLAVGVRGAARRWAGVDELHPSPGR